MRWLLLLLTYQMRSGRSAILPSYQPLSNLLQLVKAGYLAMEIGRKLSFKNRDINRLFFEVMMSKAETLTSHKITVISAAAHMLEWTERGEDLPERISLYQADHELIRAMYDVYYDDESNFFPERVCHSEPLQHKKQDIWRVYRDVLAAATQNKLMLIEAHEIEGFKDGIVLIEGRIEERADISVIRNKVRKCFEEREYSKPTMMRFLLVLSEAMTNVFKHAVHGKVTIVEQDESLHFIIEDSGTGIPLEQLPKAALLSGYSTQYSMGVGFKVMLEISNCIYLYTSEKGSTLVLVFAHPDRTEVKKEDTEPLLNQVLYKRLDKIN